MGLAVELEITHNKAVMAVMKALGKEYTFEKVEAIDVLNIDSETVDKYVVTQANKTYGVNIPKSVLDGKEVPIYNIPSSAIIGGVTGKADILKTFAEKLRRYTADYADMADEMDKDSDRLATTHNVKITRFYRRDSIGVQHRQ